MLLYKQVAIVIVYMCNYACYLRVIFRASVYHCNTVSASSYLVFVVNIDVVICTMPTLLWIQSVRAVSAYICPLVFRGIARIRCELSV